MVERLGGAERITAGILAEFEGLSRRPHGSWNEEAESAYLAGRLRELGLAPVADEIFNLMADVPATPGFEHAQKVIVQGHMDMVCAVAPGSGFDPKRDRVSAMVENGVLRTDGRSSLGADNNLGNAAVLWLLARGNISHGPLRLIFTVAEEVGLAGAKEVSPAWLEGARYLINTDGFHLGRAVVSSAGGRREYYRRSLDTAFTRGARAYRVTLSGFPGGHSGEDIDKDRPNPLRLLAGKLLELADGWELAEFSGGTGLNVIPAWASAVVVLPEGMAPQEGWVPETALPERVWSEACKRGTLELITGLYNGVYGWHKDFPGIVSASGNVGLAEVKEGVVEVSTFLRCTRFADEETLAVQNLTLAGRTGFGQTVARFPSWQGDASNPLALLMAEVYHAQTGMEMEITAVHVGLEPSFFQEKAPDLIMVSTGPDIIDAHSIHERAPLASLPPYAALLTGTLERLASET